MAKYVLDIERHIANMVERCCYNHDGSVNTELFGPSKFNEALGLPLVGLYKKGCPPSKILDRWSVEYNLIDFQDFLDYATSDLVDDFSLEKIPDNHTFFFQSLKEDRESSLFADGNCSFYATGACLSRLQNSVWITMEFVVTPDSFEDDDEFYNFNEFGNKSKNFKMFACVHLIDERESSFSPELKNFIKKKTPDYFVKYKTNSPMSEFSRSCILPPYKSKSGNNDNNEFKISYTGDIWNEWAERWANASFPEEWSEDIVKALKSEKSNLRCFDETNHKIFSYNFEVAKLMVHLPSYMEFMHDLVLKKKIKTEVKKKSSNKFVKKEKQRIEFTYKIIKSLKVTYEAEEETKRKLLINPRIWTAPPYKYSVKGHWRNLLKSWHKGHDPDGNEILGKTWVRDYEKGEDNIYKTETRVPNVTIYVKQTLAYAKDVIMSNINDIKYENREEKKSKPSKEWVYKERCKLTAGLRWIILQRDEYKCKVCGKSADDNVKLEVDHIKPVIKWGLTKEDNLRCLCSDCNRGKSVK